MRFFPPRRFVTAAVDFAMVTSAQGDSEFVADLPPERSALREAKVMSIRGSPAADQTRMCGDKLDMIAVTNAPWLRQR